MAERAVVFLAILVLVGCGAQEEVAETEFIMKGNSPAVIGFVRIADDKYVLAKCNTEEDFADYRNLLGGDYTDRDNNPCYLPIMRAFTATELTMIKEKIAAELEGKVTDQLTRIVFSASLAAASLLISRAIVAELVKVIPITLATGLGLFYVQRKLVTILQSLEEKRVILQDLDQIDTRHSSDSSLSIVEEVLVKYLSSI